MEHHHDVLHFGSIKSGDIHIAQVGVIAKHTTHIGDLGGIKARDIQFSQAAAVEKHVPVYEIEGEEIVVKVGEVIHPMEDAHYITFITLVTNDRVIRVDLKPGDEPVVRLPYVSGSVIYEYCNLHGLWKNEVK